MKTITIADVAKHAKVSKSTISQYLNNRFDYMGEETKKRIEITISELGYQPNIIARSLKQKSTMTIGVIVANILHTFSTQVLRAIEDICHENDFHVIVCNADDDPVKEKKYIDMLRAKQVDGLIIFPTGENIELFQKMVKEEYPIVFLDRTLSEVKISSVMLDNEKASSLAVNYFIEKGYQRIGIVTTSIIRNISPRVERIKGYKKALEENNLPVRNEYIKSLDLNKIQAGLNEMLLMENPPDAILAGNDLALNEILKFVKEKNLKVPEDIAVVGIDDVSFASLFSPPLTTIAQPTFEMGKRAAELLLSKIQKEEAENLEHVDRFEPILIIRESC
jgi:LacI family kdg operon repressor